MLVAIAQYLHHNLHNFHRVKIPTCFHFVCQKEAIFKALLQHFAEPTAKEILSFDLILEDVIFHCQVPDVPTALFGNWNVFNHKQPVKLAMRFEEGRTLLLTYCTPQSNDIGEVFQVSMGIAKSTIDLENIRYVRSMPSDGPGVPLNAKVRRRTSHPH